MSFRTEMGLQDLRLAVRLWWRNPWFAALTAVGLGLGIGVNNTFFALANAVVVALAAAVVPALGAARVDPATVLREE